MDRKHGFLHYEGNGGYICRCQHIVTLSELIEHCEKEMYEKGKADGIKLVYSTQAFVQGDKDGVQSNTKQSLGTE